MQHGNPRQIGSAVWRELEQRLPRYAGLDVYGAQDIAEASANTWRDLAQRLSPVLGVSGVLVLFQHGQRLVEASYPWLQPINTTHADEAFRHLRETLAQQPRAVAVQASQALIACFIDLLVGMIGERLTRELLLRLTDEPKITSGYRKSPEMLEQ